MTPEEIYRQAFGEALRTGTDHCDCMKAGADAVAAHVEAKQATRIAALEASESNLMDDRDRAEKYADDLSGAIALHFRTDVGEHSNKNSPWVNALETIRAHVADAERLAALESDVQFLAARVRLTGAFTWMEFRDHGVSSNSLVDMAYGGTKQEMPFDLDDYTACVRAVRKLPRHRRTRAILLALFEARSHVKSRCARAALKGGSK